MDQTTKLEVLKLAVQLAGDVLTKNEIPLADKRLLEQHAKNQLLSENLVEHYFHHFTGLLTDREE